MYLMIENVGECPVEGFTMLGVSLTRNQATDNTIGQFGSGLKHGMMTMLRNGIDMIAYSGTKRITFGYEPKIVENDLGRHEYRQVVVNVAGKKEKLSVVLEHGVIDWNQVEMGLREFVSNAIDASTLRKAPISSVIIKKIGPGDIGGEVGKTRIFVKLADTVQQYVDNMNESFLHFVGKDKDKYLPNEGGEFCRVYKRGVVVCRLKQPSVFHYNSRHIRLDESRNADSYVCKHAIGSIVSEMEVADLAKVFQAVARNKHIAEYNLPETSLYFCSSDANKAWKLAFGEGILCPETSPVVAKFIQDKGQIPILMPEAYYNKLIAVQGITSDINYRTKDNHECFPPTDEMMKAVNKAWTVCSAVSKIYKAFPKVVGFKPMMDAQSQTYGQYSNNTVYLHTELSGEMLFKVALEEVVHHITGAGDMSRDFQDYLIRVITSFAY